MTDEALVFDLWGSGGDGFIDSYGFEILLVDNSTRSGLANLVYGEEMLILASNRNRNDLVAMAIGYILQSITLRKPLEEVIRPWRDKNGNLLKWKDND